MSLTVEDGTGLASADSFVGIDYANTYWQARKDPAFWHGSQDVQKEEALRLAADYISTEYEGLWRGEKASRAQSLPWPRVSVETRDGFAIPDNEIPEAVKRAQCELALREIELAEDGGLTPDLADPGTIKSTKISVGSISRETTYESPKSQIRDFRKVEALLDPYLNPSYSLERS